MRISDWSSDVCSSDLDIKIKDAIILPGAQDVVDGCVAGISGYCDLITRTDGAPTGAITSIETSYFNGQQIRERGIDFELSYRTPVDRLFSGASGSLLLRGDRKSTRLNSSH